MLELGNSYNKEACLGLLKAFFDESPYSQTKYDPKKVSELFDKMVANPVDNIVIVGTDNGKPVGILSGTATEMLFSTQKIATELCWYVLPEYRTKRVGLEMFGAFEYWAKNKVQADFICMVHLNDERLTKLYERKGYLKKEEAYMKEL